MAVPNVPDWLTADFLKTCLESDGEHFQNIVITSHTTEAAVPPGNNYGSHMFRVKVEYTRPDEEAKERVISLIVKAPLTDVYIQGFSDFLEEATKKEPRFYNEFISETYKLCNHNIVPKHYISPCPVCLVLEDLCASGYIMADRHKLLDFDQCQLYVKTSAKLHALSIAIHKTDPEMVESLVEDPMRNEKFTEMNKHMLSHIFQCTIAYLEDKPDCTDYMEFIKLANESVAYGMALAENINSNAPLKALVQGDPWCTNMMFKYGSAGNVVSVKLFDFQGLKFTSPVENLLTFVWTSANLEVKRTKLHELYHLYCDSLNESLEEFGCSERLLYDQLMTEIRFFSPWLLILVCMMMPITLADGVANIADVFGAKNPDLPIKEQPMYKLYQGSSFNKYFPDTLHQLAKEGVFEYLKEKMEQISAGMANVPEWLTADFLKNSLESDAEHFQNIVITNQTIEPAVPPGNNYGSNMFRVKIEYTTPGEPTNKQISVIVKAPLTNTVPEEMKSMYDELFKKEPRFYNEFINETYKLCKHDIVPKHYTSPNPMCLILEDLCASSYVMADRHKLLDFDQCTFYVKASAKLHALSMAIHNTNPKMVESLAEDQMKNEQFKQMMKGWVSLVLQCSIALLEERPDCKNYLNFLKDANENDNLSKLIEQMMISNSQKPLKALVQGDPWCTNMMFKYDSAGNVVGVKIFDFQGIRFTSPIENLVTFVWVSANPKVRETKLNDLYHLYCDSLNENLAKLGCSERLTFDELKAEVQSINPWLILIVFSLGPITLSEGAANMNDFFTALNSNEPVKERSVYKLYQGNAFNKYIPGVLRQLDKEGVFDSLKEKILSVR